MEGEKPKETGKKKEKKNRNQLEKLCIGTFADFILIGN